MTQPDKLMSWQPIETAPKNAKKVLVYCLDEDEILMAQYQPRMGWTSSWNGDLLNEPNNYEEPVNFIPTHWMPLPESPEAV